MNLDVLFGAIFGVGGAGALTVMVTAYRRLKRGAIDDDESIIKRLYTELRRMSERAEAAEKAKDQADRQLEIEIARRRSADELAWMLKLQVIKLGGKPTVELPAENSIGVAEIAEGTSAEEAEKNDE